MDEHFRFCVNDLFGNDMESEIWSLQLCHSGPLCLILFSIQFLLQLRISI